MRRSRFPRAWRRVGLALAVAVMTMACDDLLAPPVEDPPPAPGFVVSTPAEVRTLHDVAVIVADHTGITSAFAVGTDGTILHFDGAAWAREASGVTVDLESVSGVVDEDGFEHVFAVGAAGTVVRRTGASGDWEVIPTGVTEHLFGVWVRRDDDAFVVGDNGRVLRWDGEVLTALVDEVLIDTGAVDEAGDPIAFPIADPLKSVMGRNDEVFAVGPRGSVYRFDGTRFLREDTATNRPLVDVFTRAGVWAAATDGVLLRRRDGSWRDDEFVAPAPVFLQGIWARGDGDVFAVGLSPDVFHLENGAWTITSAGAGVALRAIDGAELPPDPDAAPPAEGEEPPPVVRQVLAVGAGGRVIRGPLVTPLPGEVALTTVAAED
jgi:hypothetical protein